MFEKRLRTIQKKPETWIAFIILILLMLALVVYVTPSSFMSSGKFIQRSGDNATCNVTRIMPTEAFEGETRNITLIVSPCQSDDGNATGFAVSEKVPIQFTVLNAGGAFMTNFTKSETNTEIKWFTNDHKSNQAVLSYTVLVNSGAGTSVAVSGRYGFGGTDNIPFESVILNSQSNPSGSMFVNKSAMLFIKTIKNTCNIAGNATLKGPTGTIISQGTEINKSIVPGNYTIEFQYIPSCIKISTINISVISAGSMSVSKQYNASDMADVGVAPYNCTPKPCVPDDGIISYSEAIQGIQWFLNDRANHPGYAYSDVIQTIVRYYDQTYYDQSR